MDITVTYTGNSKHRYSFITRAQVSLSSHKSISSREPLSIPRVVNKEFNITYSFSVKFVVSAIKFLVCILNMSYIYCMYECTVCTACACCLCICCVYVQYYMYMYVRSMYVCMYACRICTCVCCV